MAMTTERCGYPVDLSQQWSVLQTRVKFSAHLVEWICGYLKSVLAAIGADHYGASLTRGTALHLEKMRKYFSGKRSISWTLLKPTAFIQPVTWACETMRFGCPLCGLCSALKSITTKRPSRLR